jgi:hypothetical protein
VIFHHGLAANLQRKVFGSEVKSAKLTVSFLRLIHRHSRSDAAAAESEDRA